MKKLLVLVSLALILGLVLTGCKNDTPKPTAEPSITPVKIYTIGDTGPGGGIVFYSDSTGAYREVSDKLQKDSSDTMNWSTAKTTAEGYASNGYDDWYLPTPAELNQLKKSTTITETATLWTSEEWGYWNYVEQIVPPQNSIKAWVYNFASGDRSPEAKTTTTNSARAVRSYSPKKYTTADIGKVGPGGGKIFWVDVATGAYKEISEKIIIDSSEKFNWYQASGTIHDSHNTSGQYIAGNYTGGGFNDWYLPNISELNDAYTSKTTLITDDMPFWSSSEFDYESDDLNEYAWCKFFNVDGVDYTKKEYNQWIGVRAIRAFHPVGNE